MVMRQPVKTSIKVDTILESTLQALQEAQEDQYSAVSANGVMSFFVDGLSKALLSEEQQQQVQTILTLWKACRYGPSSERQA